MPISIRWLQAAMPKTFSSQVGKTGDRGFSMIEVMLVMAIVLVLSALAIPTLNTIRTAKLRGTGSDYASLLQQARLTAVQNDKYYSVVVQSTTQPYEAFIDLNGNGKFDTGEPVMVFPSNVFPKTYADNPPGLGNLESQALASSSDPSLDQADNPTFGPRGLPCKTGPAAFGSYTVCLPASSGTVIGTSYITFFQSQPDKTWAAVVLNPAARVRVYKYAGQSWSLVQ